MVLVLAGALWAAVAPTYESMLGARILQGLGTVQYESITFDLIGDMYHGETSHYLSTHSR